MKSELIRKIVLATDGSEYSTRAVKYAVELARISEARIFTIYVVDTGVFASIPADMVWENMYEMLRREGDKATNYVEENARSSGVEVESTIIEGHPAEEIVKFSDNLSADMIVMGTLGKTGLDRFLLGSVAEKVSRTSNVPVMTVRGEKPK